MPRPPIPNPPAARGRPSGLARLVPLVLWALAVGGGFRALVEYELRAGVSAGAPAPWPEGAARFLDPARRNLVLFAHPQCPCSRASMAELAVIMTRCPGALRATVFFYAPDSEPEAWARSALWRTAAAIPGVTCIADRNNAIATRFGAATSGQAMLFDRDGRRLFAGGITGGRGHEGDNPGRAFVIALARGEACTSSATPVFGCSLREPARTDPATPSP